MQLLRLIKGNIRTRSFRAVAILLSTAILMGVIFGSTLFNAGMEQSINLGVDKLGADIIATHKQEDPTLRLLRLTIPIQQVIVLTPPDPHYMDIGIMGKIAAVNGVQDVAPQLYVGELRYSVANGATDFPVVALDPESDFSVRPWLNDTLKSALENSGAVVGASTPFDVGDELTFKQLTFKITGKLAESKIGLDNLVFISLQSAYLISERELSQGNSPRYRPGQISAVLIRTDPSINIHDIAAVIESKVYGIRLAGRPEATGALRIGFSGLQTFVTLMGVSIWTMTSILITALFSMTVNERRKEIGILRALGATKIYISKLILTEVLILVLAGSAIGILGSGIFLYGFSSNLSSLLGIPYVWPSVPSMLGVVGLTTGVALVTAAVAAFYPVFRSVRFDPYDAIRSGE